MPAIFKVYITNINELLSSFLNSYLNNHLTDPDFNRILIVLLIIDSSLLSPYILKDQQV